VFLKEKRFKQFLYFLSERKFSLFDVFDGQREREKEKEKERERERKREREREMRVTYDISSDDDLGMIWKRFENFIFMITHTFIPIKSANRHSCAITWIDSI
jgi:hypothetical protein